MKFLNGLEAVVIKNRNDNKCVIIIFIGLLAFIFIYCYTGNGKAEIAIIDNSPSYAENRDEVGQTEKINLNTADADELDSLMYIGKSDAELIIDYREQNGDFQSVEDIKNVKGLTLIMQKVIIDNCVV